MPMCSVAIIKLQARKSFIGKCNQIWSKYYSNHGTWIYGQNKNKIRKEGIIIIKKNEKGFLYSTDRNQNIENP